MKMTFTVVDLDGKEHTSKVTDGWNDWKKTVMGAIVYAHEAAADYGPVRIKSIQRIDV